MIILISPVEAVATALLLACVFVGVLYAIPSEIRRLPRDAPEHVSVHTRTHTHHARGRVDRSSRRVLGCVVVRWWWRPLFCGYVCFSRTHLCGDRRPVPRRSSGAWPALRWPRV